MSRRDATPPAPFIVAADHYTATTIFRSTLDAEVRIVPPFIPGEGMLDGLIIGGHEFRNVLVTSEATVLSLSNYDEEGESAPIARQDAVHLVGALLMEVEAAHTGGWPWIVPKDTQRFTPLEAQNIGYHPE